MDTNIPNWFMYSLGSQQSKDSKNDFSQQFDKLQRDVKSSLVFENGKVNWYKSLPTLDRSVSKERSVSGVPIHLAAEIASELIRQQREQAEQARVDRDGAHALYNMVFGPSSAQNDSPYNLNNLLDKDKN